MRHGGKLRQMRAMLYRLKRGFGLPLAVHYQTSSTVNLETGRKTVSRDSVPVDRAILLPTQVHQSFKYDIGYLKANSNFTYGGFFTIDTREIIIAASDLPDGFQPEPTDQFWIVYEHRRYSVKSVAKLDCGVGYFIVMEFVSGVPTYEIHRPIVVDRLVFTEALGWT